MIASSVSATLTATTAMKWGGGIVIGTVGALVENFVHERAPPQSSSTVSLSRRRPQSPLTRLCTAVHALPSRVGRPRRGSTSAIPDRAPLGSASGLRALLAAVRSHSVRPNYAFERTANRHRYRLFVGRAAAQRER
jgi:hypothetical protein